MGDTLGVNPLITLAGLYFGLKLFGFLGMFIVPISIMTLKAFNDTGRIHLWNTLEEPKSEDDTNDKKKKTKSKKFSFKKK